MTPCRARWEGFRVRVTLCCLRCRKTLKKGGLALHLKKTHSANLYWSWRRKQEVLEALRKKYERLDSPYRYHRGASEWAVNLWTEALEHGKRVRKPGVRA